MPLGTEVGLGPGHIVLDGDPDLTPPKGGTTCGRWLLPFLKPHFDDRSPPYIVAKSIHLNSDYRISGPGECPRPEIR